MLHEPALAFLSLQAATMVRAAVTEIVARSREYLVILASKWHK
jgi:hypothetical protein